MFRESQGEVEGLVGTGLWGEEGQCEQVSL